MKRTYVGLCASLLISFAGLAQKESSDIVFKTDDKIIYDVCFAKNGKELAIADGNSIKVYSTTSRQLLHEFKNGHSKQLITIDVSEDSSLLVSGGKDSTIVIWDYHNKTLLKSLAYQKGIVTSVKISPDGNYMASGGTDRKVYLFNLKTNEVVREFADHADDITCVEFSRDGRILATASGDKTINIYDLETLQLVTMLKGHTGWVRDLSFSKDEKSLISCGDDGNIITWSITDTKKIRIRLQSRLGFAWILSVDNNEDNITYAFGDVSGRIMIKGRFGSYDKKLGAPVHRILFKPNNGKQLGIVVSTRGKGVVFISAKEMKINK
jgi:WD40 repeat protein